MTGVKRILDVGQCGVDGPRIGRFLTREFDCVVDRAGAKETALTLVAENAYDLILVNRILDRVRTPGLEVIAAVLEADPAARVMLVSDIPEAQEAAVKLGAMAGFGKSMLETDETVQLLCRIICDE